MTEKELENFINEEKDNIKVKKETLSKEQFKKFETDILECGVNSWKEKYINRDIVDGTSWKLQIMFKNNTALKAYGLNDFPKNWDKFTETIEKTTKQKLFGN